ncbi:serine/threonine-protein kinase/endoribonuclease IRE1a-like [Rhodamnia argentea]|uniref:non-specific serine/threonine protein kinase n=1 Tax=Rhodamnia argentea TaxID=178133 RepID=A0A8B8PU63_9MYRT|nr:serine/threonine-protein kinase/endoribonuclease IRE1a-like [Rhodamnia argentea]
MYLKRKQHDLPSAIPKAHEKVDRRHGKRSLPPEASLQETEREDDFAFYESSFSVTDVSAMVAALSQVVSPIDDSPSSTDHPAAPVQEEHGDPPQQAPDQGKMSGEMDHFQLYVTPLSKSNWSCNFCGNQYHGGTTRIKAHFSGIAWFGTPYCKFVHPQVRSAALLELLGEAAVESSNGGGSVEEDPNQPATTLTAPSSSAFPPLPETNFLNRSPPAAVASSNGGGNVEEGPRQPATAIAEGEFSLWQWPPCSSSSAFLPLFPSSSSSAPLPNHPLPAQNMNPQWDISSWQWQQPPQSLAADSDIQLRFLSYPDSPQDLVPKTLTDMPHPANAEEEQPDTEVPQGGNEGRMDITNSIFDEWVKLNHSPDGGIGWRTNGKIHVSNRVIGKGSNGTIVLQGYYEGRCVAVKRLVWDHHDVAFNEIKHLILSDRHPNIVRYYGVECNNDFVYLALERCTCSLDDLIQAQTDSSINSVHPDAPASMIDYNYKLGSVRDAMQDIELWRADGHPSPLLRKMMRDVVSGLAHLHVLGIIHRDLKPQNILISKNQSLVAHLSDMGISRCLPEDKSSLGYHATGCGSSGWRAPEQLLHGGRQTRAMDLFSLGCVLFFCITCGRHPFGEPLERDYNIVNNRMNLSSVEFIPEAVDLFSRLLVPNPELRPKAWEVLHHPFFWSSEIRLSFLRDVSDRVELEARAPNSDLLVALQSTAPDVFQENWASKIETDVMADLRRRRTYDGRRVRDLLRAVRNKFSHHMEAPEDVKEILGPVPDGLDAYFAVRFPRLLIESYKVVSNFCKEETCFQKYFSSNAL